MSLNGCMSFRAFSATAGGVHPILQGIMLAQEQVMVVRPERPVLLINPIGGEGRDAGDADLPAQLLPCRAR